MRWIALFRGINVGGKNILPMKKLAAYLAALNCRNVQTYIQSGNVVFDADCINPQSLIAAIGGCIQQEYGFLPKILLITPNDLQRAIALNPFPDAISDPKSLHFYFVEQQATNPNIHALDLAKSGEEHYTLIDCVFYLYAPDGVGRSKLAASAERHLGVAATARNYRTVEKLWHLVAET